MVPESPRRAALVLLALAMAGAAGGCAAPGHYPSLAIRDVERVSATLEPVSPEPQDPVPVQASPGLDGRVSQLVAQARAAQGRFAARTDRAEALVSAATTAPVASEAWSVATVAISQMEAASNETGVALADLDALHAADQLRTGGVGSADSPVIMAARDQVGALVAEQGRRIASLRARIRS